MRTGTILVPLAATLLSMAAERYRLFHDAAGALDATHLAAQALAGVDAPVYAPLRVLTASIPTPCCPAGGR